MNDIKVIMASCTPYEREHHDFHLVDRKGRRVGALILTREVVFTERRDHTCPFWRKQPGLYYTFKPVATRSHGGFGASQAERYFESPDERDVAISLYLTKTLKRMAKTHDAVEA